MDQHMRAIERLWRRVSHIVGLGRITATDDSGTVHQGQVKLGADEIRDNTPVLGVYGLASHARPGSDAVVLFIGGDRSNGVVVATGDQRVRPTGTQPGDVVLHNDIAGMSITLGRDGIRISGGGLPIVIEQTPSVTIKSKLVVEQEVTAMSTGAAVNLSTHTHRDPQGGTVGKPEG